ncbi:MAG: pyruvate dehydrogenase (acetyl-transferring), homodimeric type [Gammaproteobacteria bacterium]|nr:pyruvate dehydrogenase (acetyl-transferring), homodimeric type [Gammaproteobacteria bacterium]
MNERNDAIEGLELEEREWVESLDYLNATYGAQGTHELLRVLLGHATSIGVPLNEAPLNTAYVNTIPLLEQPPYPGDIELEKRIENLNRWNAMAMVLQAADAGHGVGGHIATFSSAATQMEVGFQHFFRKKTADYGGDIVIPQPHAAPGVYARAFLEGRLSEDHLKNFRRQLAPGGGLSSYPHPRAMPDFWAVPCASMGLSTPTAIYQARFAKYLENRGLKPRNGGKVWCFIGDGEADEPEVLGTISIAAREKLDNLILIVNCNLQRLDGPVRGNGKIIQELERRFRGADWNVIKVIWGGGWDGLLAQDHAGILRKRMEDAVDGDYQYYSVLPGDRQREHWVVNNPELERLMNSLTDEEVRLIKRGGQDPKKIFAAYHRALASKDKPTVILVKTVKGDGLGAVQGKNTVHQKKNLKPEERERCARDYGIPLATDAVMRAEFYRPPEDSPEIRYLKAHRQALGGYLPAREVACPRLTAPPLERFAEFFQGSNERAVSTTAAAVRLLTKLLKDPDVGRYVVPIVPDEARTFGMDALFKAAGIYAPEGQNYTPVDAGSLLPYKEAVDGQILQEGICETGAMASFLAAGTAYAMHGIPTIPFYIFYSIFGFQRVGDMIWACGDMLARGFLLGGTAGRTTLNGEGLQHQDGHSQIVANTVPNLKSYDPAFAYELAIIIRDGIKRMYEDGEAVFYYLTVYNENYVMPAMPDEDPTDGILRGIYRFRRGATNAGSARRVHLLASGSLMQQALAAVPLLEARGCAVDVWSVTSFNELQRDALACERWNRLHPEAAPRRPYLQQALVGEEGAFVAVTDYMKSYAGAIAPWVPGEFVALGTDGYGVSETREALRRYFEVDPAHIVLAALDGLKRRGAATGAEMAEVIREFGIDADAPAAVER